MLYSLKHPIVRSVVTKVASEHLEKDCSNDKIDLEILISKN